MNLRPEEDSLLRRYLLDDVTPEERRQVEDRLLLDDEYSAGGEETDDMLDLVDRLLLVEDELIDDYAREALAPREYELFRKNFRLTTERRQKLAMAEELSKYAFDNRAIVAEAEEQAVSAGAPSTGESPHEIRARRLRWINRQPERSWSPQSRRVWKLAACVTVVLALGLGWWVWSRWQARAGVEKGMLALNHAYRDWRPLKSRVTGLDYAPFSETRGPGQGEMDVAALKRAERLLSDAAENEKDLAAQHAMGRLYLARKGFTLAITAFEKALQAEPDNARLHNDLGAALLEQAVAEQAPQGPGKDPQIFNRILGQFQRALELDSELLEALFNRALLRQSAYLWPQAQDDWESYLKKDATSPWAGEALRNLRLVEEQRRKVSQREEQLYLEFVRAYQARDEEAVWQAFSRGYLRTGNQVAGRLIAEFLVLAQRGPEAEAQAWLQTLDDLGKLAERKSGDRYLADLAGFYRSLTGSRVRAMVGARDLLTAAHLHRQRTRNDLAIAGYQQAKRLLEELGDTGEALLAAYGLGACYIEQADAEPGRSSLIEVARVSRERGYKWLQSLALNGLANLQARSGEYSQAIASCWRAHDLARQISDDNGRLRSLNMLAGVYSTLGKYHESWEVAQQGLALATQLAADPSQMIGLYAISAWNCNELGLYAAALAFEEEAVRLGQAMRSPPLVMSRYYVNLGLIYARLKDYAAAVRNIERGLESGRGAQPESLAQEMTAYAQLYLGRVYRAAGDGGAAIAALAQVEAFGRLKNEARLLHAVAKERLLAQIARGDDAAAQEELPRVLALYEEQRAKILEEGNRNSFFAQEQDIYDVAIRFAYFRRRDAARAFEYSETSRARSLLDDVKDRERRIVNEGRWPERYLPANARPLSLSEIQRRLPERAQLLQYAALEDKLVIWLVSRQSLIPQVVDIPLEKLTADVAHYLDLLSHLARDRQEDRQERARAAGKLYEVLIAPVAPWLDKRKQLCIVPDKALHFLPYGALLSRPDRYMVEDYWLIHAPSASLFVLCSEAAQRKAGLEPERLLSVGNPRFDQQAFPGLKNLPAAAREAREITGYYASHRLLTEEQASKSAVLRGMEQAEVIHLALHHLPEPTAPLFSKLLLAAGGEDAGRQPARADALLAYEVYRLKLERARLVVLSACQTGASGYFKGEGAMGFLRPFEAAGVPLVVASLWEVDSPATAELMINFHCLRKRQGLTTTEALRAAQLRLLHGSDELYRHPYYWAAFVTVGGYSQF